MEYVQDLSHMNKLEVLYEDNHIIVVVKPCNILSQADSTGDIDMLTIVKKYIKEKYHKPGNVYLGLVHRLDRPVGGVMIFARSSRYLAVVNGFLQNKNGSYHDYLLKREDGNTVVTTKEKGKEAVLEYKVLKENKDKGLSLIDILLLTGRHHQIRVQFASRGNSLYGDQRYGKCDNKQIALWAYSLTIYHPLTKEQLTFKKYPFENGGIWKIFE